MAIKRTKKTIADLETIVFYINEHEDEKFVYSNAQRDNVIRSVWSGFPLGSFYFGETNNTIEIIDGWQRLIAICQYLWDCFCVDYRYFHNLDDTEKNAFLSYELDAYLCNGTADEKQDWCEVVHPIKRIRRKKT